MGYSSWGWLRMLLASVKTSIEGAALLKGSIRDHRMEAHLDFWASGQVLPMDIKPQGVGIQTG